LTRLKKIITWTVSLLILILGITFTLLNPEFVIINLGFKVFSMPLVLLILLVFILGVCLGFGISLGQILFNRRVRS
jgi:uncharacterized integral membrane protein